MGGLNGGVVHANDLALDFDQHFFEWLRLGPALFGRDVGKARVGVQLGDEAAHIIGWAGQEQVNPLFGQQNGAFEA